MSDLLPLDVMVIFLGQQSNGVLREAAEKRGWRMIVARDLIDALKQTFAQHPRVYVVYIGQSHDEELQLIRLLRWRKSTVQVIAACEQYTQAIEKSVRRVGALGCDLLVDVPDRLYEIIDSIERNPSRQGRSLRARLATMVRGMLPGQSSSIDNSNDPRGGSKW